MSELHLYDFGIFIELTPDEEQKALLENNIQAALAQESIDLEDAIDLRDIRNVKLANQLLKIRRKKKLERDQKMQQENIQSQAMANVQTQQAAAQSEMQKKQADAEVELNFERTKSQLQAQRMQMEAQLKKELMDHEFEINIRLKKMEVDGVRDKEVMKEDRKDERTKIQATQQSELIDQKENKKPPKKFESTVDEDIMGGLDMTAFGV